MDFESDPRGSAPIPTPTSFPPAAGGPWSEVTALGEDVHRVRLGGFFGPTWLAHLCQGVADRRLSIERAHAMRARNQSWMAELTVVALAGASDPKSVPYVELAESSALHEAFPYQLESYELVDTLDHGGTLRLTIEAADTLGLLGSLLTQFAELGLFPIEMHIDTRAGRACDCFWLGMTGASRPTREARAALDAVLLRALGDVSS